MEAVYGLIRTYVSSLKTPDSHYGIIGINPIRINSHLSGEKQGACFFVCLFFALQHEQGVFWSNHHHTTAWSLEKCSKAKRYSP